MSRNQNWHTVKLRDVTTKIGSGATPRGGKESYKEQGISLIRSLNVYDLSFDKDGLAFIDAGQAEGLANVEVQSKDILLNITGASVARCCMVPDNILPARVNQHVAIIRLDQTLADPYFVLYSLVSPSYKHYLLTLAQGGATREALTKSTIEEFEIALPALCTQRKIAAILSAYDDLIENNTRRIAILEEMARLIYREWFVHFRFPGHEGVEMVETEVGLVPEGWGVERLGSKNVTSFISRGYQPKYDADSNCRVINQRCIRDHRIDLDIARGNDEERRPIRDERRFVRFGDVLVNSTGIGTLGRVAQVYRELVRHTVDSHVTIVRPSDRIDKDYFGLTMWEMEHQIEHLGVGATGQTELSKKRLAGLKILVPPVKIQSRFSAISSPMRRQVEKLLDMNKNLRETRDLLLPRLVSGEVDVSEVEVVGSVVESLL